MAKKYQCEQCDAFIKERELCRKTWKPTVLDDTECESFCIEEKSNSTRDEVQENKLSTSQSNRTGNIKQQELTVTENGLSTTKRYLFLT